MLAIVAEAGVEVELKLVAGESRKRVSAGWEALGGGFLQESVAKLRERLEVALLVGAVVRRNAEEGEAGDELQGVDAAAHQVFERGAAGELVADGGGDFFVAGAEERVAQVIAGFREIADGLLFSAIAERPRPASCGKIYQIQWLVLRPRRISASAVS